MGAFLLRGGSSGKFLRFHLDRQRCAERKADQIVETILSSLLPRAQVRFSQPRVSAMTSHGLIHILAADTRNVTKFLKFFRRGMWTAGRGAAPRSFYPRAMRAARSAAGDKRPLHVFQRKAGEGLPVSGILAGRMQEDIEPFHKRRFTEHRFTELPFRNESLPKPPARCKRIMKWSRGTDSASHML